MSEGRALLAHAVVALLLVAFATPTTRAVAQECQRTLSSLYDSKIQQQLINELARSVKFQGVRVYVDDGFVQLTGTVGLCADRQEAVRRAHAIAHVCGILDHIVVKTERISDDRLKQQLKEKLTARGLELGVEVKRGIVVLSGEVPQMADHERALSIVADTSGVRDVDDRISVRPR